jgi:hypothetical protein
MHYIILFIFKCLALSLLQNGKLPSFFEEWQLQDIFQSENPNQCLLKVREGLKELGVFQVSILDLLSEVLRQDYYADFYT